MIVFLRDFGSSLIKMNIKTSLMNKILPIVLPVIPSFIINIRVPRDVVIEPTNFCNLRCPLCATTSMKRSRGYMILENFKFIIDSLPKKTRKIDLFLAGEPVLNREIYKMMEYATKNGKKVVVSTNGIFLDKDVNSILDSGLDDLIIAMDGATKETYDKYRIGGNFNSLIKGLKKLCEEKRRRNLTKPRIQLQFVIMKHNEHEIQAILDLAKKFGVDNVIFKSVSLGSVRNMEEKLKIKDEYLPENKQYSRYKMNDGRLEVVKMPSYCHWIWQSVILWNGDLTMCCHDFDATMKYANIFEKKGFLNAWRSKEHNRYRRLVLKRQFEICKRCSMTSEYYIKNFKIYND